MGKLEAKPFGTENKVPRSRKRTRRRPKWSPRTFDFEKFQGLWARIVHL